MAKRIYLPSTVSLNAYKAYINENFIATSLNKNLNAMDLKWDCDSPKTLRLIVLDSIIQSWHENPILSDIPRQADRNYILENLDVNLPIKILSTHIKEDTFWKRCFRNRWAHYIPEVDDRKWISIYMEKDLAEILENLEPSNYDQEEMQRALEVTAPFVETLEITCLQPSMDGKADHIPFDFILSNLSELKKFRISYIAKRIGTNFYLGCSYLSQNDAIYLCRGLQKTYDLLEFCLLNTRLMDESIIKILAKSLDNGCPNLTMLNLANCRIGDDGFMQFIKVLSADSFVNLRKLILANNNFTQDAAFWLSKIMRGRKIEHLDLHLNPIGSDGAGTLLSMLAKLPIKRLDFGACSITESIERILLKSLIENKTLFDFDISNNDLGNELGEKIYRIIGFNQILKRLDLRNTGIWTKIRKNINSVLFENRDRL